MKRKPMDPWVVVFTYIGLIFLLVMIVARALPTSEEPEPTYDEFSYVTDVLEDAAEVLEEMHEDAYILSAEERDLIERVVCAEAEDHSFIGKAAVALCIRNYCELFDMRPEQVFRSVSYAEPRDYATDEVKQAVSAVFDTGFRVTE